MIPSATRDPRVLVPETRRRRADAPIVAAVDASASGAAAAREAVAIAKRLGAPVVFVYVRGGPSSILGEPYYQRRLDAEMARAKRALGEALAAAEQAGVAASGEVLEGAPARRLVEFADLRAARLVVLGPRRRRRFRRSVSRRVVRRAERPVMVARGGATVTT
jgi:nucleotide-binding universal stress UspA family protein